MLERTGDMSRLDGRSPTARFAETSGRPSRLDGRSPTAHFVILSARSLRPRLDDLPDARLLDGALPWTSARHAACPQVLGKINAVECSAWISKPHACSMPSQAISTHDALPPSRRREHARGMAGNDALMRSVMSCFHAKNLAYSILGVERFASRTFLLNTRMRI